MAKRWKREDITYLKRYAAQRTLGELSIRFKTDEETVEAQLVNLGVAARGSDRARYVEDPAVAELEKAVRALHAGKLEQAKKSLDIALNCELSEVAGKAKLYLRRLEMMSKAVQVGDPYLQAVYEKNNGEFANALSAAKRGGRWDKEGRFAYLGAAALMGLGEIEEAEQRLQTAVDLAPEFGIQAKVDPDFAELFPDEPDEDEVPEDQEDPETVEIVDEPSSED